MGWAVAFLYVASAAIRLARFNAVADTADSRYFSGLATASGYIDSFSQS